jgi:hypothetical protein
MVYFVYRRSFFLLKFDPGFGNPLLAVGVPFAGYVFLHDESVEMVF